MPDGELRFRDDEVAQILWMLVEAIVMAEALDASATRVLLEDTYGMVRRRFDERGDL